MIYNYYCNSVWTFDLVLEKNLILSLMKYLVVFFKAFIFHGQNILTLLSISITFKYLIIIQILTAREGNKFSPRENHFRPRRKCGGQWFLRADNFLCYPINQSISIILYWILIEYTVYITSGFKTVHEYLRDINIHTPKWGQPLSMVSCMRSYSDIFWNITRR